MDHPFTFGPKPWNPFKNYPNLFHFLVSCSLQIIIYELFNFLAIPSWNRWFVKQHHYTLKMPITHCSNGITTHEMLQCQNCNNLWKKYSVIITIYHHMKIFIAIICWTRPINKWGWMVFMSSFHPVSSRVYIYFKLERKGSLRK